MQRGERGERREEREEERKRGERSEEQGAGSEAIKVCLKFHGQHGPSFVF